jgi:hypothetical protein
VGPEAELVAGVKAALPELGTDATAGADQNAAQYCILQEIRALTIAKCNKIGRWA